MSQKKQSLKDQIKDRQAYNRMQRGQALSYADRQRVADFIARGKPAPDYGTSRKGQKR